MRFDAAIFDYDGVLVELDRRKALELFTGRAPLPVRALHQRWEVWCKEHIGDCHDAAQMWRDFWRALGAELSIPAQPLEEISAYDYLSLFRLCPDTMAALAEARALGLRIGVLSNSALPRLQSPTAPLPLTTLADAIHVPGGGNPVKPQREAYEAIARQLGTTPDRCLFFDNEPEFVAAAAAAGMRAFLVRRGEGNAADGLEVLRDLTGLRALVEEGAALAGNDEA